METFESIRRSARLRRRALRAVALAALLGVAASGARADIDAGRELAKQVCAACHGADGNSQSNQFPVIAAQTYRYLTIELRDFKAGRRKDPMMSVVAQTLSPEDIVNLAEYFSAQKYKLIDFKADQARVDRGRAKAAETLCTMCHLGEFSGSNEVPRVAGQYPEYIQKQLAAFKTHTRTNDAGTMTSVAGTLADEDIVDLSHYIANLP
ncbi:MAG TPA: c-type cytochrome [Burkholderiaceae bacterium]|nr:c-type cytochrome [Burkholderiaceae bacterium]